MNEELLKAANIPETWWPYCNVIEGIIYTPTLSDQLEHGLITRDEYEKIVGKQIDILEMKPKTNEELTRENEQLWETIQFLLKKTGMIGDEEYASN